ncbi:MAG: hypothetical protein JSS44_08365 [Proteobacteria bacterium]|nr:hypothetical protein [Pseudomonadota bacterium]MBS0463019.1 hypothetical protein [Pseudomonadota bacterium]MBS0464530.1 hypothetical protein [Pseudomonadota bacterium]
MHLSAEHWRELTAVLVLLALTVLPVSLAAGVVNARRSGMLWSALAVFVGGIVAQFALVAMGATTAGVVVAFLAMCAIYALVLRTSLLGGIGIAVLAFILQVLFAFALALVGLHLHGWPR